MEESNNIISENKTKRYYRTDVFDVIALFYLFFASFTAVYNMILSSDAFSYIDTVIYDVSLILSTLYITVKKRKFKPKAIPVFVLCILLSIPFSLHSDLFVGMVILILLTFLTFTYFTFLTDSNNHSPSSFLFFSDLLHNFFFTVLKKLFLPYVSMHRTRKERKHLTKLSKNGMYAVFGAVAGIIVLCIIIPLLISGDAMFEHTVNRIFGTAMDNIGMFFDSLGENIFTVLISVYMTLWIFPFLYSALFSLRYGETELSNTDKTEKYINARNIPSVFFTVLLTIISVAYTVYIATQIAYFFSAFSGRLPAGSDFSLSEYARRGFFEMIAISFINFLLISLTVLFAKRKNGRLYGTVKLLDVFLAIFSLFISAVSVAKIMMYINKYGLTYRRISVTAINIVIIVTFITVILKMFIPKLAYMKIIITVVCIVTLVTGYAGIDNIAVKYNMKLYKDSSLSEFDPECFVNYNGFENLITLAKEGNKKAEQYLSDYWYYTVKVDIDENVRPETLDRYNLYKTAKKNRDYLNKLPFNDINYDTDY